MSRFVHTQKPDPATLSKISGVPNIPVTYVIALCKPAFVGHFDGKDTSLNSSDPAIQSFFGSFGTTYTPEYDAEIEFMLMRIRHQHCLLQRMFSTEPVKVLDPKQYDESTFKNPQIQFLPASDGDLFVNKAGASLKTMSDLGNASIIVCPTSSIDGAYNVTDAASMTALKARVFNEVGGSTRLYSGRKGLVVVITNLRDPYSIFPGGFLFDRSVDSDCTLPTIALDYHTLSGNTIAEGQDVSNDYPIVWNDGAGPNDRYAQGKTLVHMIANALGVMDSFPLADPATGQSSNKSYSRYLTEAKTASQAQIYPNIFITSVPDLNNRYGDNVSRDQNGIQPYPYGPVLPPYSPGQGTNKQAMGEVFTNVMDAAPDTWMHGFTEYDIAVMKTTLNGNPSLVGSASSSSPNLVPTDSSTPVPSAGVKKPPPAQPVFPKSPLDDTVTLALMIVGIIVGVLLIGAGLYYKREWIKEKLGMASGPKHVSVTHTSPAHASPAHLSHIEQSIHASAVHPSPVHTSPVVHLTPVPVAAPGSYTAADIERLLA